MDSLMNGPSPLMPNCGKVKARAQKAATTQDRNVAKFRQTSPAHAVGEESTMKILGGLGANC
jgi:hypothetical protein